MKCPYQKTSDGTFAECTVDCPACKYEVEEYESTEGRKYPYQSVEQAIERGTMWRVKRKAYNITGCKYVDNMVKPTDSNITNIENVHKSSTSVTINKSIF